MNVPFYLYTSKKFFMNDPFYLDALKKTKRIQKSPIGFSDHQPSGTSDQILIKQNNIIIQLIIELNKNIERIIQRNKAPIEIPPSIDELVEQLKKVELTPQIEKTTIRKKKSWTFFQVGEESKTEQPEPVSHKTD